MKCFFCLIFLGMFSFTIAQRQLQTTLLIPEMHSLYTNSDTSFLSLKQKRQLLLFGSTAAYAGSLGGLYYLWYKDYPQSSFHFFNDNAEWFQMDKYAHATTSYYLGSLGYHSLKWAGMDDQKAIWLGGFTGSIYLSIIEILDGFSAEWGASWGDFLANTSGSLLFSAQQALWNKQHLMLKYSFRPSPYAQYRPELMGQTLPENAIKDYNGISCWLSVNMKTFFPGDNAFPKWLCLSIGQSGDGMTGSFSNAAFDRNGKPIPTFERKRQFLLSADIDLTQIPFKSKYFKAFAGLFSFIKMPFPTLEYNKMDGFMFHPFYF